MVYTCSQAGPINTSRRVDDDRRTIDIVRTILSSELHDTRATQTVTVALRGRR